LKNSCSACHKTVSKGQLKYNKSECIL